MTNHLPGLVSAIAGVDFYLVSRSIVGNQLLFSENACNLAGNWGSGINERDARAYPVTVAGTIDGAIVVPEVEGYPPAQVEIIAPVGVREALGIEDGDPVEIEVKRKSRG